MFYQVIANMLFSSLDEANDFYRDCELAMPKTAIINPDTIISEASVIQFIGNRHDLQPTEPCILMKQLAKVVL